MTCLLQHAFNPKRALTRAQFMEIVTGMAIAKFVKTGICPRPSQVHRTKHHHAALRLHVHNGGQARRAMSPSE
jgi:hypothetical protein